MSEYPIVILGAYLRDVQDICRKFAKTNPINSIERKGQAKYRIKSNGKEYWIMHQSYYEEWSKGRTYYKDGKLMHSGYELKEKEMNKIRPNASIYLDYGEDGRDCHHRISFKCPNCNKSICAKDIACTECGTFFDWSKKATIKVVRTIVWE